MSTIINSVQLDNDLVWTDEYEYNPLRSEIVETIGGGSVSGGEYARASEKGRLITLESQDGQGYQRKSTLEILKSFAAVPDTTYLLSINHNGLSLDKTVRFRSEIDGGAIQFQARGNPNGLQKTTAWYSGTIYLMIWS